MILTIKPLSLHFSTLIDLLGKKTAEEGIQDTVMEWNGRKDAEHSGSNDAVSRHPGEDMHKEPEGWVGGTDTGCWMEGTDTKCWMGGDTGMECWVGETDTERWVGDMDTEFSMEDMATEREWDEGEGSKPGKVRGISTRNRPLVLPVLFSFLR